MVQIIFTVMCACPTHQLHDGAPIRMLSICMEELVNQYNICQT
jgi:hypothetical protein